MLARIAADAAVAVVLAAPPPLAATPEQHNCAGVFASTSADGHTISGLAIQFRGVSELVLPDANCGDNAP
jgi:hypothetical protein